MSQRSFVGLFVLVGVAVPILWFIFHSAMLKGDPSLSSYVMNTLHLDRVLLAIWPSSALLMADPEGESLLLPLFSLTINAALYGALGWLVWIGFHGHRAILAITTAAAVAAWYMLFDWYLGW